MTEINRVRRRNRAVDDDAWIEDFLSRAPTCVIGTASDGRAFLNPNTFLFDREARQIFFHTAGHGRTRMNIEANDRVTICVFEMGRLLPAPDVLDYSTEYASVVVFGRVAIVTDAATTRRVFDMQMLKYFPHHTEGKEYRRFTDEEAARPTVYRVDIEQWSGKKHVADADYPGAWWFPPAVFRRD
jgi:nitroimidazol reductase NimA-like FMN-containing flavoprotein (pyridoxamine 5'-phosphate oxidase superfamily)